MTGRELLKALLLVSLEELDQVLVVSDCQYESWVLIESNEIALTPKSNVTGVLLIDENNVTKFEE